MKTRGRLEADKQYSESDKIKRSLQRAAEFNAVRVPKNVLFHFSLIFENFKGVRFTDLIFRFIFDFIFDDLCLQKRTKNESQMDQKQDP